MKEYIVSVDLAQKRDYTAIMVFQDTPVIDNSRVIHYYDIVYINKFQGVSYPETARAIAKVMNHERISLNADLLVDGTGVGAAVIDLLREEGIFPVPIVFTTGTQVTEVFSDMGQAFGHPNIRWFRPMQVLKELHVPKLDLVTSGSVLLQQGRIRAVPDLPFADDFRKQMYSFTGKKKGTRISYEADSELDHDDLVVCFLMASWWILHRRKEDSDLPTKDIPLGNLQAKEEWSPYDFV